MDASRFGTGFKSEGAIGTGSRFKSETGIATGSGLKPSGTGCIPFPSLDTTRISYGGPKFEYLESPKVANAQILATSTFLHGENDEMVKSVDFPAADRK